MTHRTFRNATPVDAARFFENESSAYDGDDAATLDKIVTRIAEYPQEFLVLEIDGEIAGFINSGCAGEVERADEAFKELIGHDAEAPNVVILSSVVDPAHQARPVHRADVRIGRAHDAGGQGQHPSDVQAAPRGAVRKFWLSRHQTVGIRSRRGQPA